MKKALIHDTRICQLAADEESAFPCAPPLQWVDVPDDTTERDTYVNGAVVKEPAPPAPTPIDAIVKIETGNPFTHRALREFFIGFGTAFPDFQQTLLYQRAKAADDAIRVERAKL